jgi:flagellar protein FliO/FliZ
MATLALVGLTMIKVDPAGAQAGSPVGRHSASISTTQTGGAESSAPGRADEHNGPEKPSVVAAIAKMISALAVVIAVVYGALYLLRKLMGRRYGGANGGSLEVLQTTYVGPHKAISLVRVGRRSVLVGVTDNQISTLTELDSDETDEIVAQVDCRTAKTESFSRVFAGAVDKLKMVGLKKKQAALET